MKNKMSNNQPAFFEQFSYALYFVGQCMIYILVTSFVLVYLLNAGLNGVLVGSLLLIPKIWDAVNDPIFGTLVDKLKFKHGRFKPWVQLSVILLPITTIFLFGMPFEISQTAKCVWLVIGYVLWDLAYTISDAPIYAMSTTISSNPAIRTRVLALSRVSGGIGGMVSAVVIPILYGSNGANLGWRMTAIFVAIISMLTMLPIAIVGKERNIVEPEKEPSLMEMLKGLGKNKALMLFLIFNFIANVTITVNVLVSVFSQYVLKNEAYTSILAMAFSIPALLFGIFAPALIKKIDKFHLYIVCISIFALASVIQYYVGYHDFTMIIIFNLVRGLGYGGAQVLAFMFVPDCIEYGQYKVGVRNEGISFSLQTFSNKLVAALTTSVSAVIIAAFGFKTSNVTVGGMHGVWFTLTIFSAIGSCISIPCMLIFYKLRDKDVKLIIQCNTGEITKSECESRISRKL